MKKFDEYWQKHATDEFLSKAGVKTLCEDMNKELIVREQRIRRFWDVAPSDFDVIANGKGTLECGTRINNK